MVINIVNFILLFLLLNVSPWVSAASIGMTVDRDPVHIDESFQIIFESSESVDDDPDYSPIKKHFTILNTRRSSNTSIVNGRVTHANQWILTVMAKKTGTLSIPSVHFGKDKSRPGTMTVMAAGGRASLRSGDIFLEVEVAPEAPYVQAQVIYTVRLYRSVVISNASLSDPQFSDGDAVIAKLGDDRSYEVRKVGIRYIVIERRYAIFPQSSGDITIEPVTFQGQIGRNSGFFTDPFGPQPKVVMKKSKPVTLHVRPIPQTFTGKHWLPLRKLALQEQWSVDPSALSEGEPATRTLKLIARGLTSSQLPDSENNLPDTLKQYPDQPVLNDIMNKHGITGTREDKIAVIPTRAGAYNLPAIKIPWWNTETDKQEYAILPERTIVALPSATANKKSPGIESGLGDEVRTDDLQPMKTDMLSPETVVPAKDNNWKWVSIALAVGWCMTLLLWWKIGGRQHASTGPSKKQETMRRVVSNLKQACQRNDPVATKNHILKWAGMVWPDSPPSSLGQIEKRVTGQFSGQLHVLNQTLYSAGQLDWNGNGFFQAFETARQEIGKIERDEPVGLEPLYRL